MSDPLTPAAVTALAQQAAESPAHLDPVLVQQVCREWQIGQQAAALQRCIVEAAYQDKVKAEQQRDAALAEQDALREQVTCGEHERMALVVVADAIRDDRTEARRVLREVEWAFDNGYDSEDACALCHQPRSTGHLSDCALAAVLAQEEK